MKKSPRSKSVSNKRTAQKPVRVFVNVEPAPGQNKVWNGVKFAPVAESNLFNVEIEGTAMPTAPLGDIFNPTAYEHR